MAGKDFAAARPLFYDESLLRDELIFRGFMKLGLLYRRGSTSHFLFSDYLRFLDADCLALLDETSCRPYHKLIWMNAAKFTLACQSLGKPIRSDAISAAVRYVLLGCLLDAQIDNGPEEEKRDALRKLDWSYCAPFFETDAPPNDSSLTDRLLFQTGCYLQSIRAQNPVAFFHMIDLLKRIIESEIYVSAEPRTLNTRGNADDKSVLFTALGFLIAASGNVSEAEEKIFLSIGNVFRIVDDLCDIEEDMRRGQRNSVCARAQERTVPLSDVVPVRCVIQEQFQELERELTFLQNTLSRPFIAFLLYELQDWTLTNPFIRSKILR